jgi:hypothetical protein
VQLETTGVTTDPCEIMDPEFGKHSEVNLSKAKLPLTAFEIVKERALREIAMLGNSYHNRFHTEERVIPACEDYAREARLSPRDSAKLTFGALYHDFGHTGHTYRQLVAGIDTQDLSNEEFAGMQAVSAAAPWFSEQECEEIRSIIHASSHNQNHLGELPPEHAAMLYRAYKPETNLEKILVLADVSSFRWGTDSYLRDGINLIGESPYESIPTDFPAFLERAMKFLTFIQARIDGAAPLFSSSFVTKLSDELRHVRKDLVALSHLKEPLYSRWKSEFDHAQTAQRQKLGLV